MKNKFLLMAVISALAALVIVPSTIAATGADPDVGASVTSGSFLLTASGVYTSEIDFGGFAVSSFDQSGVKSYALNTDGYFELYDYDTGVAGGTVTVGMKSDFHSTVDEFAASNLRIAMNEEAGVPEETICRKLTALEGCKIVVSRTSSLVNEASVTAGTTFSSSPYYTAGSSNVNIAELVTTDVAYPYVVRFALENLKLTVPKNLTPGRYTSTIYVLASQP